MIQVYFIALIIVFIYGILLYCRLVFDKPNNLDKDLKPDLIIGFDYWDSLALPFLMIFPFSWILVWSQSHEELSLLPFIITILITTFILILLLKYRFNRYYFTNEGIVILSLLTKKVTTISIDKIVGYSYRPSTKDSPSFLIVTKQKKIHINTRQIKNIPLFKDYFKKHKIDYFEYDWLTGNDYKK